MQCSDILTNYKKYAKLQPRRGYFSDRLETARLFGEMFAGKRTTSFIPVSGSQFQEKYVGGCESGA
jgi:hypothetical protein